MEILDKVEFKIIDSIKDISKKDWESLFGTDSPEGYGYQKSLEESGIPGFDFGYVVGTSNNKTLTTLPFFINDFSLGMFCQGLPRSLIASAQKIFPRFLRFKLLFIGSPTTEEFKTRSLNSSDLNTLVGPALEIIHQYCRDNKINATVFYNLSGNERILADYFKTQGFFCMNGLPSTMIEIKAKSLDEFIQRLGKSTRKDLRHKLRNSALQANLTTETRDNIESIENEVYSLYLNNFNGSDIHFEILPIKFFREISNNMPGVAKYFITRDNGKIVAFNLCLIKNDTCIDKFIGFDSGVAHKYHLYFTTLSHNIGWCIDNGIRFYQTGATDYLPKVRLGAKLIPLLILFKAFNPLLHLTLRLFSGLLKPENLDSSLKEISKFRKTRSYK
ncbi:MAG: GNAT family N-acetyltransferase [Candidatus Omnitrophica bacterium]|nr:GNAT family N-acetyltransferase [Candidatus Omnitrophota bacterium]MBU1869436.1 GNAT family N-acetyltransferase [Candidatus Omnitrophota bacterium]